ncbi:hypothetical protein QBC42DRAFT_198890 [Cladorrhinum samala]|uniref:Heterokaryon incompatibility domain-containing protein n=1 Tax=Cladorrhinum samala TaxID=585594 RepID=A0AAV9HWT0_9PEZI|nr:hypothetical protein QBC42DRAFT_198890 [Cladorrhinum samala]
MSLSLDSVMDLARSTGLGIDVEKAFGDIKDSPEKLRAILNLWLVPRFKPTFVAERQHAVSGLQDVDFLNAGSAAPTQLPTRMFDVETGNLVEYPSIGARGQYCMLSHRWKGVELNLGYIRDARRKDLERTQRGSSASGASQSDVELVLTQCRLDIEEQEQVIRDLFQSDDDASTPSGASFSLGNLLGRRLESKAVQDELGRAKGADEKARTELKCAEIERRIFDGLVNQIHARVDQMVQGVQPRKSRDSAADQLVNDAIKKAAKAKKNLEEARTSFCDKQADVEYFQKHKRLRDSLDEMVSRLQRWKSAIKLDRSIREASRIFKTKAFEDREKCYLWTDTCCIDKTNYGELSDSLSLMGDWYADSEYTLVQLDTTFSEADALTDWHRFEAERTAGEGGQPWQAPAANIETFDAIINTEPEWSTRAWTLQELVMSKTTFYVNSAWAPLSRPVESLGFFYYLIPFIAFYTRGDSQNMYLPLDPSSGSLTALKGYWRRCELGKVLGGHQEPDDHSAVASDSTDSDGSAVAAALEMIALLNQLGVRIPKNMSTESAISEMARAVYIAASELCSKDQDSDQGRTTLVTLINKLDEERKEDQDEKKAQHAINFILHCLVADTESLILADRAYIAKFGQVDELAAWQKGTARTGFAAQSVLEVSGKRWATVATDRAYALMGILGVRFSTFSAEGYPRALARLLDEVIITHNDVSVFNWTGMDMGSPIRGRSMYPSSHIAFGNQGDQGRRYNLLLSAEVQGKMDDIMDTYYGVITVLRTAIDLLKEKERKNIPFSWIEHVIGLVERLTFLKIKPELKSMGKIIGYITEHCKKEPAPAAAAAAAASPAAATEKMFSFPSIPTLPKTPSLTSFGVGTSSKKQEGSTDEATNASKRASRFGLPKSIPGIKAPSLGIGKKSWMSSGASGGTEPTTPTAAAAAVQDPEPTDSTSTPVSDPPPPYQEATNTSGPGWEAIDKDVLNYLQGSEEQRGSAKLPQPIEDIAFDPAGDAARRNSTGEHLSAGEPDTISPNPIIVNNSGIEGLFDIQRVVVTMVDPEKLRARVARAASPREKISGWCTISTGFAWVVTSFSCEKRILERELDVIQTIEETVLREQERGEGEKRKAKILRKVEAPSPDNDAGVPVRQGDDGGGGGEDEENDGSTVEQLGRMIEFIQEPRLQLVAGEWVLARFSGTPGANWFLCHLELGANAGLLYGHRIAAGNIDFRNSTPEPGLVNAWQKYMERKKSKMCTILNNYLDSRRFGKEGEERWKTGTKKPEEAAAAAAATAGGPKKETGAEPQSDDESEDDGEAGEEENVFEKVWGQSKLAAKAFGDYTLLAAVEKIFEMRADRLEKTLSTKVLKRTPRRLRSAVESMDDNRSLMPAMFHSSTRVHMF